MQKDQGKQLFNAFLSHYDAEAKDGIWANQSQRFRDFWNDNILSGGQGELDDADIDRIVSILDKNGKGNTRESEAVARAMIPQGAWRRMFNDIKARKELSGTINSIFLERDLERQAGLMDKLYEVNAERRNNLTGQSGNAICAMLAAFDPVHNLSVISLKDRRMLYQFIEVGANPDFDSRAGRADPPARSARHRDGRPIRRDQSPSPTATRSPRPSPWAFASRWQPSCSCWPSSRDPPCRRSVRPPGATSAGASNGLEPKRLELRWRQGDARN
jgi:hypothetical protein